MQKKIDGFTTALVVALGAISLAVIFAASHSLATSQLIFWVLGLGVFYIASQMLPQTWQKFSLHLYFFSIVALLFVFLVGSQIRGSTRWVDLGVFRFQPSEIAKVAAIIILSSYFAKKTASNLSHLATSFLIISPFFAMIFLEPDIGSAAAVIAIWIAIVFAAGVEKKHVFYLLAISTICIFLSYELLVPYQKARIATFLSPNKDPLGSGYNIIQSKIAVGSGQLFGRGLGRGPQSQLNFLPEEESDFIFASIAEQLGFLGAGLVIILFGWFLLRLLSYLKNTDRFGQLIITGGVSLFLYQFLVSIGMNMGLLPVTGITLPLISYGGSSLISMLLLLGIILSLRSHPY